MDYRTISDLQTAGFEGFKSIRDLWKERLSNASSSSLSSPGVYMVVRRTNAAPEFLERGTGGFFKGKDPNVSLEELNKNWVDDTCVVYIGQAGGNGSSATLRKRLRQYLNFGQGETVGHWGGRYIWQLKDAADLLFCWKTLTTDDPRAVEKSLISEFKEYYAGKRPFANLRD